MAESRGKIRSEEILADIRAGMNESQLMDKYGLSPQQLQVVFRKLSRAGLSEYSTSERPIPEDRALVPVEKKARDVPRDANEEKLRLRKLRQVKREREESERLLQIAESTLHWRLIGLGALMFFTGIALYVMWPYIETRWLGDLTLDRVLGYQSYTERSYKTWHLISTKGGPVMALVGGVLAVVGIVKRWLNRRRIERLIVRQRQGLVFEPFRDE